MRGQQGESHTAWPPKLQTYFCVFEEKETPRHGRLTRFTGAVDGGGRGDAEHLGVGRWLGAQALPANSAWQHRCTLGKGVRAALAGVLLVVELNHEGGASARRSGTAAATTDRAAPH